jgi:hypothetical protein
MVSIVPFMERRRFRRQETRGAVCALAGDRGPHPALANLRLRDVSDGGLAATTSVELAVADPVTVLLPPGLASGLPSNGVGRPFPGRVVRCSRRGRLFQVAVAFDAALTIAG